MQHNEPNENKQHNQAQKRDSDRPGRAQLKQVLLDVNFKDKPTVLDLEDAFGALARLLLIDIVCAMSGATDGEISRGAIRRLGARVGLSVDKTDQIVDWCINRNVLGELPNGLIDNRRVVADQESLFKKQERWRKAKGIQTDSARNGEGRHAEGARKSEQLKTEDLNIEDLRKKIAETPTLNGLKKHGEYVRLSEISYEQFASMCASEGFDGKDRDEIIQSLNRWFRKNPHEWRNEDHFTDLVDWPLKKHRVHKSQIRKVPANGVASGREPQNKIGLTKPTGF